MPQRGAYTYTRDGVATGTAVPAKYDLVVTDSDGEDTGLVIDWKQGGYSWNVERPNLPTNNSTPTVQNGEAYDVRDANDFWRIVFTDWVKGAGQESRDTSEADAALFYESHSIDISKAGAFALGPASFPYDTDADDIDGPIYAALKTSGEVVGIPDGKPAVFAAFEPPLEGGPDSVRYSVDNVTWTPVDLGETPPSGSVTCFADDGEYCYVAFTGTDGVWRGQASDEEWEAWGTGADADGIVEMAYCNGVLYAAKGDATTAAELGSFDMTTGAWTKFNPHYVSAGAVTAGLVKMGPYVYWTITNGVRSTVYKANALADDPLAEWASFPTGFVALCSAEYGGVVYVGGYYDGPDDDNVTGVGALYACTDSGPVLVVQLGISSEDWRVYAITAYEKFLYFVSHGSVWRYDLVHGGYSHWFVIAEAGDSDDIDWDVEETMASEPSEPAWTVLELGGSHAAEDGVLTMSATYPEDVAFVCADAGLDSEVGTTVEFEIPANGVQGTYGYVTIDDGTDSLNLYVGCNPGGGGTYDASDQVWLYSFYTMEPIPSFYGICHWNYGEAATVRASLKGGAATVWLNGQLTRTFTYLHEPEASPRIATGISTHLDVPAVVFKLDRLAYSAAGNFSPHFAATGTTWLAAVRDAVWVGTTNAEIRKQVAKASENSGVMYATAGSLSSSRSTARMSTIPKYFSSADVFLADPLAATETVSVQTIVDGVVADSGLITETSDEKLRNYAIDRSGREISVRTLLGSDGTSTPEVKQVVVKFIPMSTSNALHTYTVNLRDNVQSAVSGQKYDQDPDAIMNRVVAWANQVLTIQYAGLSFKGKLEAVEAKGYPQSRGQAADNQGTVRLTFREMPSYLELAAAEEEGGGGD